MKSKEINVDVDMSGYEIDNREERLQAGKYMVKLINAVLHGRQPEEIPSGLSMESVYEAAKRHGMDCIVYEGARKTNTLKKNTHLAAKWEKRNQMCAVQGIVQQNESKKICEELPKHGVRVLPMKGCIMKRLYAKQEYRHMTDVDILIDRRNMKKARKIMENLGYQFTGSESEDTVDDYIKKPWMIVEMHTYMLPFQYKNHEKYIDIWDRCTQENGIWHMNWNDFYVFMIEHFAKHFALSGSGIRFVLDIYVFLEKKGKELDQDYIKKELKEMGLENFRIKMEKIAYDWFGVESRIGDSKYETVTLLAGAFGITEWRYASNQKEYLEKYKVPWLAKSIYVLKRTFPRYHDMAAQYPFLRHLPFLLPFAWILRFFRVMFKSRLAMTKEFSALKKNIK